MTEQPLGGIMIKRKIKCAECKNRKFASLNDGVIRKHLQGIAPNGTDVVGIYPMTEDECCYFLAMDFDGDGLEADVAAVQDLCGTYEIPLLVERSRSGLGGMSGFSFRTKYGRRSCGNSARCFWAERCGCGTASAFPQMTDCFPIRIICRKADWEILLLCRCRGWREEKEIAFL